ncbi:hypothetical protein J6590_058828 [Homalodisca vitripennis]|nr:hypothetical protein J6590_058828 [Homalodisca vitripennis]
MMKSGHQLSHNKRLIAELPAVLTDPVSLFLLFSGLKIHICSSIIENNSTRKDSSSPFSPVFESIAVPPLRWDGLQKALSNKKPGIVTSASSSQLNQCSLIHNMSACVSMTNKFTSSICLKYLEHSNEQQLID